MTAPQRQTSMNTLHLIRLAIFSGALLFGIVTWWLRRENPAPLSGDLGALRFAGYGLWVGVLVLLGFVRGLYNKATDHARRASMAIVAWGASESLALYGGVIWYLHGDSRWYLAGMLFLLATFILFSIARD